MPDDLDDIKALAAEHGCERAIKHAIEIIQDLERQASGLSHAIGTLSHTVEDQQRVIVEQSTQIGQVAQALAEAQVELTAAELVIASQQATIGGQQATIAALQAELAGSTPAPRPAASAIILINGGKPMGAVSISVDDTESKATLVVEDDHQDVVSVPGIVITWTSDNPSAVTIAADPTDPSGQTADLAVAASATAGMSANISATLADAAGNPVLDANGAAITVTPQEVDLVAGPAAEVVLSVAP